MRCKMDMKIAGDYFDGQFYKGTQEDEVIKKLAPSDISKKLWEAPVYYSHIEKCIESASTAYKSWRLTNFEKRIELLQRYQEAVLKRVDHIAHAISWETGKPLWEAKTEANAVAAKVNVTISDSLERIKKQTLKEVLPQLDGHVIYRPLGPSLVIGPYNFPCHLANGQILSSLLAGNTVIFKPSEKTIYSSQLLIECFHEAGFPKGVINFINGSAKTSSELVAHHDIKAVFFTGSHGVGLKILDATYRQLNKMVALEMGGRNCTVVNDYTNEEHVLSELIRSAYLSTGQRCTSTSVVFIKRNLYENFVTKFYKLMQNIKVDHSVCYETAPFMGPLVDELALQSNEDFHHFTMEHGGEALCPFQRLEMKYKGYYTNASLYTFDKTPDPRFFQPEIFGPHLSMIPYDDFEETLEIVNSTPYGLAASLFTQDKNLYEIAARDLEVGIFNLNRSTVGATARLPFGGLKNSGNFRPAAVNMIDHCVSTMSSLETLTGDSKLSAITGLIL